MFTSNVRHYDVIPAIEMCQEKKQLRKVTCLTALGVEQQPYRRDDFLLRYSKCGIKRLEWSPPGRTWKLYEILNGLE